MSTENTATQESQLEMQPIDLDFNPFKEGGLSAEQIVVEPAKQDAPKVEEPKPTEEQKTEIPAVDYNLYVKEKFGFDSEEVALAEISRLKEQKPVAEPLKFENETSEKFFNLLKEGKEDEVLSFLSNKKQIERLASATVDNLDVAAEIIKLGMQSKYKDLTKAEIDYKFNKQFAVPLAPRQTDLETDDEFAERLDAWKLAKEDAEREIIIEAKVIRPELEKLKTELKLPELEKPATNNEDAAKYQEELAKQQQADADFKAKVPDTIKALNGVNVTTTVKYGDVELPVSVPYVPSDAERAVVQSATEDSMKYLATRWFDEQGVADPKKVANDMFFLENKDAILQKVATESATQAVKEFMNKRANVKLDNGNSANVELKATNPDDDMAKFFLRAS